MENVSLKDLVREAVTSKMHQAIVHIDSDRTKNLTHMLDQLRGVCGITVVTVLEPAQPLSAYKEMTKCKIKFLQTHPSLATHLKIMKAAVRQLPGVYSFRVLKVKHIKSKAKEDS
tara:strand:- start:31 stop:375 length:345 start_codon:yes stop_codon:yes gene_type:complete